MTMYIAQYEFEGPLDTIDQILPKPGIVALLDTSDNDKLIDVIHGVDVSHKVKTHKRYHLWKELTGNALGYAVMYTHFSPREQKSKLLEIEMNIRDSYGRDLIQSKHRLKPKRVQELEKV